MSSSSDEDRNSDSDSSSHRHRPIIPPLSPSNHKGSMGRIGVLGGSERYTGAPYYAAMASLKAGADLATVFCAQEASGPIKCYSPELMVAPVYNAEEFERALKKPPKEIDIDDDEWERVQTELVDNMAAEVISMFDRMHVLVIGPGLGRCPLVFRATASIIERARLADLPLIVDADALFLLTLEPHRRLLSGYRRVVLTPNAVEYRRLVAAAATTNTNMNEQQQQQQQLSAFEQMTEGNIIIQKGHRDSVSAFRILSPTKETVLNRGEDGGSKGSTTAVKRINKICAEEGGLKRSGGLGDLLAGTLGAFVAWNRIETDKLLVVGDDDNPRAVGEDDAEYYDDLLLAGWTACCAVKRATRVAFEKKRRAMTAPDVLEELGAVISDME